MKSIKFNFEEAITRPDFRRESLKNIEWENQRRELLILDKRESRAWRGWGKWEGPGWLDIFQSTIGEVMVRAWLMDDKEMVLAGARVWAHNHDREKMPRNILTQTLKVLQDEGRMDLFRPMVSLLAKTSMQLWRDTEKARECLDEVMRGSTIPRMNEDRAGISAEWHSLLHTASTFRGAAALDRLGKNMVYVIGYSVVENISKDKHSIVKILGVAVDAALSVEEIYPWHAHMFIDGLGAVSEFRETAEGNALRKKLELLTEFISDSETAAIVRRLVDFQGENENNDIRLIAHRLIDTHPNLTLDDWIRRGIPGEISNIYIDRNGLNDLRENLFNPQCGYVSDFQQKAVAQCYETLLTWIGSERAGELSANTYKILSNLLLGVHVEDKPLPQLRSALDRWSLVNGTETTLTEENPKEIIRRVRRAL